MQKSMIKVNNAGFTDLNCILLPKRFWRFNSYLEYYLL